jgi:hypothetical protein
VVTLSRTWDSMVSFTGHIDVTVGRVLAMLGFVEKVDHYTLGTLYVSLVRRKVVCGGLSMAHTSIGLSVCKRS